LEIKLRSSMAKRFFLFFIVLAFIALTTPVFAQAPESPPGPVYIVQDGDTLWDIAARFNVSVDDIVSYNSMPNQDIYIGDRLIIPGLQNLSGILNIQPVPFGETLRNLSRQYKVHPDTLIELNRIVSPEELFAGYALILLQQENSEIPSGRDSLGFGETLLELAVRQNSEPWVIAKVNDLDRTAVILPGDVLAIPGGESTTAPSGFPPMITFASLDPLPITQGQTIQVKVISHGDASLGGALVDYPLHFFRAENDSWIALQGIHAMTDPGLYPIKLTITLTDGIIQSFEQMVLIEDGGFRQDPALIVDPTTIDPVITVPEDELLYSLTSLATPLKLWKGIFQLPVDDQYSIYSTFGNRRSYNGGDYIYFHTGVDFGIVSEDHPFDIYSPAVGTVVFAGLLTVRGNATIIDHGWGIYSGLYHQEAIYVTVGDQVEAGQLIGKIGKTGRVTGPHLHWEVWANGVQVDPIQWLDEEFPH
jgi:murein DD-endopeptidase MepM/ murein hydrolase activator NlpD